MVKPSRPAVAIDALWYGDIFKAGGLVSPTGEVTETYTAIPIGSGPGFTQPLKFHFVLGWGLDNAAQAGGGYNVTGADIRPDGAESPGGDVAWPEYLDGNPAFDQMRGLSSDGVL